MEYPIYCQLTASNTVRDQKTPYTIYEIEVRSSSTIKWVIYRRYSDFFALHQELLKIAANGQDGAIRLPYLPPKRLTRSLAVGFVEKRKLELQAYLTELLRSRTLVSMPCVLQFLAVPDSVRPMLIKQSDATLPSPTTPSDGSSTSNDPDSSETSLKRRGVTISPEERKVRDFITQLNTVPNKVNAIRSFQQYYFSQRPRFTAELIIILFEGSCAKELGLIWACGDLNYSIVSSKAALEFICRLLDVEKNKDAQQFLDVISTFDIATVKKLNLHRHILNDRASPAFQLAYILSQAMPSWTADKCLLDITARQEFQRWGQRKMIIAENHGVFVDHQRERSDDSPNLTVQYSQHISKAAFETLHAAASSDQGWKAVPGPLTQTSSIIQIVHKQISEGQYIVRLAAALSADPNAVFNLILDDSRRKKWDLKIHSSQVVQRIDDNIDIVDELYLGETTSSKPFDLTMVRCWRQESDGSFSIVKRSVSKGNKALRASMTTGFLITPIHHEIEDAKSTLLLWLAQLDRESIQLIIADLLGESDLLLKSFSNLNDLLEVT